MQTVNAMKMIVMSAVSLNGSLLIAKDHPVSQKGKAFSVETLTVAVGDSIVFKNDDDTSHNVFSTTDGQRFNLGIQKQGSETAQKFEKVGEVEVRCAIHPKMKLKVVVKQQ